MKILVIGANGQLGREIQKKLYREKMFFNAYDIPDIDITNIDSINRVLNSELYDTVINCAAYTNVDSAESDYEVAYNINAIGPKNLALACATRGLEIVHVSTDYVFSGEGILHNGHYRPYLESDECHPNTAYGKTKLEGERFVQQSGAKYYILRTAWLYGDGNNFVRTMLKLSETHHTINVVKDQIGSPTSTVDLANVIFELLGTGEYGLYHATCEGQCSWFDFANKIFELSEKQIELVPVTSEEFVRPAKRPAWSVLENKQLKRIGKNVFRPWEDSLKEYLTVK